MIACTTLSVFLSRFPRMIHFFPPGIHCPRLFAVKDYSAIRGRNGAAVHAGRALRRFAQASRGACGTPAMPVSVYAAFNFQRPLRVRGRRFADGGAGRLLRLFRCGGPGW